MEIENIAVDLNGTIAADRKIPSEVKEKINCVAIENEPRKEILQEGVVGVI